MPSKKRKYNARFPAGRIKKIMQTDEEVGKVAQAVPIIICYEMGYIITTTSLEGVVRGISMLSRYKRAKSSRMPIPPHTSAQYDSYLKTTPRTLELFVESLLSKAMQVTMARNAKTLSPSHVKQCILAESRFDFLRDLVKNIPDVSAAEEKEMMSAENSPNSSRFSDMSVPPRRIIREDSNSSSSSDMRVQQVIQPPPEVKRAHSVEAETPAKPHRTETATSANVYDSVIDLSKKPPEEPPKPLRTANFYNETLPIDDVQQHRSVITVNPTYSSPQPSTSSYTNVNPIEPVQRIETPVPKPEPKRMFYIDIRSHNNNTSPVPPPPPRTPVTPILNIDFTKSLAKPEIKVLDTSAANMVNVPKNETTKNSHKTLQRQNSKPYKESKRFETKTVPQPQPVDIDHLNSGNLQIDEDYDT